MSVRRTAYGVRRRVATLALTGMVGSLLAACGAGGSDSDDSIQLLLIGGKTGATSTLVAQAQVGLEAGIAAVNDAGGIDGKKLKLSVLDDGSDPTRAVSALQQYLAKNGDPDVVLPGISSAEALAVLPTLTRNKLFSINGTSATEIDQPSEYPYHFGYMPTNLEQQVGLVRDLKGLDAQRVVAVVSNDAYGKTLGKGVEDLLTDEGFDVSIETYNPADVDLSVTFERVLSEHPDAIFMDGVGDAAHRLVDARETVGANKVPTIVGSSLASTEGGPSNWASAAQNENLYAETFTAQKWVAADKRSPQVAEFYKRVEAAGGIGDDESSLVASIFYDMVRIYAAAADEAGSTEPADIAKVLENDPELPGLVQWKTPGWISESHFPTLSEDDVTILPRSELVDGQYRPIAE